MYGRCAKGENGHGIAISIITNAIMNQRNIVLNLSPSATLRLANAEPIVINTIAVSISNMCTKPKKVVCIS